MNKNSKLALLAFALLLMIGFTVLAFSVLQWQNSDISVSIVSDDLDSATNGSVTISVINTADSNLLFYKSDKAKGKIEYLDNDIWVDFCDVEYGSPKREKPLLHESDAGIDESDASETASSDAASDIESLYGDMFATLEPGEEWIINIPEESVAKMQSGTYRVVITYISERKFLQYINDSAANINDITEGIEDISESSVAEISSTDISNEVSQYEVSYEGYGDISEEKPKRGDIFTAIAEMVFDTEAEKELSENYLGESKSEVFVKNFNFEVSRDITAEADITDEASFTVKASDNGD